MGDSWIDLTLSCLPRQRFGWSATCCSDRQDLFFLIDLNARFAAWSIGSFRGSFFSGCLWPFLTLRSFPLGSSTGLSLGFWTLGSCRFFLHFRPFPWSLVGTWWLRSFPWSLIGIVGLASFPWSLVWIIGLASLL
jgi:hypothetical protein